MSAKGIQYMTYRFIAGFAARYQQANCHWMLDPRSSGGGCTINLAPHFFDLALLLMGDRCGYGTRQCPTPPGGIRSRIILS